MKKSNTLTERSYFLIQIDHTKESIPSGIAAKMVGDQNCPICSSSKNQLRRFCYCIKLEVLEIEGNSDKENPYIAF